MSGIIGQVLSSLGSGQGGSDLASTVQQIFNENGGVSGIVGRFQNAGLGEQAQSWVSGGPNQPITEDHIGQVFNSGELQGWAEKLGIPPEMVSTLLAQALPQIINHFTPNGVLPAHGEPPPEAEEESSGGLMGLLGKLLGR